MRSSCIPTAATATPTSSPARSICSKRSTDVKQPLPDRRRSRGDPRLLDGRGGLLAIRRPLPWLVRRRGPRSGLLRNAPTSCKVFQNETVSPPWYEQKLWHLYDCTDYAVNLFNCPTVAYSGENDRQKQAADMMAAALQGRRHRTDAHHRSQDRALLSPAGQGQRSTAASTRSWPAGRNPVPRRVRFTTFTLRYNRVSLGATRRPGEALGARSGRRRDRRRATR